MLFSPRTLDRKMELARTRFERLATFEDLDREALGRESAEYADEVQEWGKFSDAGAELSRSDFQDAVVYATTR